MRTFDEIMTDVAMNLPADLLEELQDIIEEESADNYDAGYRDGQDSLSGFSQESYNEGYADGLVDGQAA
jgi:hypothetical protein